MKLSKETNFGYIIISGVVILLIYQAKASFWLLIYPISSYAMTWIAIYFQQKRMKKERLKKYGYSKVVALNRYETEWTVKHGPDSENEIFQIHACGKSAWEPGFNGEIKPVKLSLFKRLLIFLGIKKKNRGKTL